MSKTRPKERHPHRAHRATAAPRRALALRITWIAFTCVVVAALVVGFIWFGRSQSALAKLPEIPTTGLDAASVQLLQQQREEVRANPQSAAAWGKLGGLLKSFGFRDPAATSLAEAERLDPREARWPYLQATLRSDAPVTVIEGKLRRAVHLCGNVPEMPRLRLVRLLSESGRDAEAREELRQLLNARPDCGPARMLMARFYQAQGGLTQAMTLARESTTNAYTARAAWTLLAELHRRQGDTNAAMLASRRAAAAAADVAWPDPYEDEIVAWRTDARSLSDRAQNLIMSGRAGEALPLVRRLRQEHPGFTEAWLLLGRALNLLNQPVAAEEALRRLVQLEPESVNGHFQLGTSLMLQKRYPEAAEVFRRASTLKADFGPAFFNLAYSLVKSGRLREAVPAFERALQHNPEKIDTYILLSDLHLQLGEKEQATRLAHLAAQLDPTDARLPALRGKLR